MSCGIKNQITVECLEKERGRSGALPGSSTVERKRKSYGWENSREDIYFCFKSEEV